MTLKHNTLKMFALRTHQHAAEGKFAQR